MSVNDLPEAEEVPDLLLARLRADALDVYGIRHGCGVVGLAFWYI